jgi:hypothetical protein
MRLLGAIAQLGERRHGMAEVEGSSPSSSIFLSANQPRVTRPAPPRSLDSRREARKLLAGEKQGRTAVLLEIERAGRRCL